MAIFQAVCGQGVIMNALAPDMEAATDLFERRIGNGHFPWLYGLWEEFEKKVRLRQKKSPEAARRRGKVKGTMAT